MTSRELRQSFLDFFAKRGHRVMAGAPLKPSDETTLFTSAGMQQFVPWFQGIVPAAAPRVVTCQKCFRSDDIEEVGRTPWHETFFEMLGNFSFGDYFKRGAIEYGWEYVTKVLELPESRIWITVNPEDDESPEIWREVAGIPAGRIVEDATNWWGPVGKSGPCGPNTEIHVDCGEELGCGRPECGPTCGCRRFVEIWNLVFQMYDKTEAGELEPLPKPGVDTGMGFERVAAVMQGVSSVFDTDLLAPIRSSLLSQVRAVNSKLPEELNEDQERAARVIAEHTRALTFLLVDGFTPSNDGAGYVLRRVLRRAYRFGRVLGVKEPFLHKLVPSVVELMGEVYPELRSGQERTVTWLRQEEKQFEETLERSYGPLMEAIGRAKAAGAKRLAGEDAFKLHDTYGLPKELTADVAAENGLALDEEGFEKAMEGQRQRARARAGEDFAFAVRSGYGSYVNRTRFLGYGGCEAEGAVIGIITEEGPKEKLGAGDEGEVFLDQTPFYAETGGQVGDRGSLEGDGTRAEVADTTHPVEGAHAHSVRVIGGTLRVGQRVRARVDAERRRAIARAHTATHLLHHMLRHVLGEHAVQSGSLVDADRLRFDFAHFAAVTREELQRIEEGVVALALEDHELVTPQMRIEQARAMGAVALFGEKYGERVRVVQIGGFSKELCGGTHLPRSSAIGGFAIAGESSIGAGLRRIEAVTGREAHKLVERQREWLGEAAGTLRCKPEEIGARVKSLQSELRQSQREIVRLQQRQAGNMTADLLEQVSEVDGVKVLAARVDNMAAEAMRNVADGLLAKLGSGVVVLGGERGGRVQLVSEVSKDLVAAGYHAGNLAREVAKLTGGGGGGRPDFAQAGGKNPEQLDEALAKVKELVAAQKG